MNSAQGHRRFSLSSLDPLVGNAFHSNPARGQQRLVFIKMERPKGIGPIINAPLLAVRDRERHNLKVVLDLVEGRLSNKHLRARSQPLVIGGRGEHVEVVNVVEQPRARERPIDGARVHRAGDAGGTGVEQRQACTVHLPEPWRCLDTIEFNVDERLVRIAARSEQERDAGDVRGVFGQVKRVGARVVRGEHDRLTGQPPSVGGRIHRLGHQRQRGGVQSDTKSAHIGLNMKRDIEHRTHVNTC